MIDSVPTILTPAHDDLLEESCKVFGYPYQIGKLEDVTTEYVVRTRPDSLMLKPREAEPWMLPAGTFIIVGTTADPTGLSEEVIENYQDFRPGPEGCPFRYLVPDLITGPMDRILSRVKRVERDFGGDWHTAWLSHGVRLRIDRWCRIWQVGIIGMTGSHPFVRVGGPREQLWESIRL